MSPLTVFGAIAVAAMLVAYAFEHRSRWWVLVFAGCCAGSSLYGWLAGTWPFGIVEGIWCLVALRRWLHTRGNSGTVEPAHQPAEVVGQQQVRLMQERPPVVQSAPVRVVRKRQGISIAGAAVGPVFAHEHVDVAGGAVIGQPHACHCGCCQVSPSGGAQPSTQAVRYPVQ